MTQGSLELDFDSGGGYFKDKVVSTQIVRSFAEYCHRDQRSLHSCEWWARYKVWWRLSEDDAMYDGRALSYTRAEWMVYQWAELTAPSVGSVNRSHYSIKVPAKQFWSSTITPAQPRITHVAFPTWNWRMPDRVLPHTDRLCRVRHLISSAGPREWWWTTRTTKSHMRRETHYPNWSM